MVIIKSYCSKCEILHDEGEMCPYYAKQLKVNPNLFSEASIFASIASQYHLVSSQTLDKVAQSVNKLTGSNLTYEGSKQFARDIRVFKQLNVDSYCKSGHFSSAQSAQDYFNNGTKGQLDTLLKKLNGTGQEVDWEVFRQGKFSELIKHSKLLGEEVSNAPGIDGVTINRFTGSVVEKTTVKAATSNSGLGTNISDVLKALEKGTLDPNDTLVGIEGTQEALTKALDKNIAKAIENNDIDYVNKLKQAKENMKVTELNNYDTVKESTERLTEKIKNGQANTTITANKVGKKAFQGAVIGTAISLTISSLTNFIKYKNGEISEEEAFKEIGEDTLKGSFTGGAMGAITIFLPGGALGFIAGIGVGIYINATCKNVLDEIFGKGAYKSILDSSGFVFGTTSSLSEAIRKIENDEIKIQQTTKVIRNKALNVDRNLDEFSRLMKG